MFILYSLRRKNLLNRQSILLINHFFLFESGKYLKIIRSTQNIWLNQQKFCWLNQIFPYNLHWEKNAIESKAFLYKSMYIMDSNQYAMELVTYLLVLVVYFYGLIVYMLLERNAFDSIAFFSQCTRVFDIDVIKWTRINFFAKNRFYLSIYSPFSSIQRVQRSFNISMPFK